MRPGATGIERRLPSDLLEEIDAERYATAATEPSAIGFYDLHTADPAPLTEGALVEVSHPDGLSPALVDVTPPPTPGRIRRHAGLVAGWLARDLHDIGGRLDRLARRWTGETL